MEKHRLQKRCFSFCIIFNSKGVNMKITIKELKEMIREQVEEIAPDGVMEARAKSRAAVEDEGEIYEVRALYYADAGRFVGYVTASSEGAAKQKAIKLGLVESPESPSVRRVSMSEVNKHREKLQAVVDRAQEELDAAMNVK